MVSAWITDWAMPIFDGLELTQMIRQPGASGNPYVPIIMLTAHSEKRRVTIALEQWPFAGRPRVLIEHSDAARALELAGALRQAGCTVGVCCGPDAAADPAVRVVGTFPEDSHPPIIYPAAVTAAGKDNAGAAAFLGYLRSATAKAAFERQGFTVLGASPAT